MPPGPVCADDGRDHHVEAADVLHREVGGGDHRRHHHHELDHVDDEHAPEAGVGGEDDVEHPDEHERLPAGQAEQHAGDLARRQVDGRHDHAVEEQTEVDGAEPAHHAGGGAGVADLVELEIGHHPGAAPQPGVEEHRRHAGQGERPPHPVAGDALAADDVGDEVRRVAGKRRRHHRQSGEPPRHRPPRDEELRGALAGPPAEEQRRHEADQQRGGDDDPVDQRQVHGWVPFRSARSPGRCTEITGREDSSDRPAVGWRGGRGAAKPAARPGVE